ncbi:MAG: hypothetical protein ACYTEK_24500, partial [Planctomycetota bacterium]
ATSCHRSPGKVITGAAVTDKPQVSTITTIETPVRSIYLDLHLRTSAGDGRRQMSRTRPNFRQRDVRIAII